MADDFAEGMRQLIRARFPLLYIQTPEESRVLGELVKVFGDTTAVRARDLYTWTLTGGLAKSGGSVVPDTRDPNKALVAAAKIDLPAVVIFLDLHPWLGSANVPADPQLVRQLRDLAQLYRDGSQPRMLILISPTLRIPVELENIVTVVDFPLPDEKAMRALLTRMVDANAQAKSVDASLDDATMEKIASGALGLTQSEAENAFARAMANDNKLDASDIPIVMDQKRQIIRRSGVLEVVNSDLKLDDIGGLANLKKWLVKRNGAWTSEATGYALPAPKGVLITGVPGCGKSMTAKAMASAWQIPLIRLDIGRVFAGLVGASEENMRKALNTAEAIAPCVLWIDEIEKGFSSATGERDSGTSARVFGSFLTWMQERTKPVFVIATANDISKLPPEFMRKGRFDEIFFIDLPTAAERRDIFKLHLTSRLKKGKELGTLAVTDAVLDELASSTEGFTGSEIEQAVISACFDAFDGRRPLTVDDVRHAIATTVPLSVTQAEDIAALRSWADMRAVSASTVADRAGYVTPEPDAPAPVPDPTAARQRGGRAVEA